MASDLVTWCDVAYVTYDTAARTSTCVSVSVSADPATLVADNVVNSLEGEVDITAPATSSEFHGPAQDVYVVVSKFVTLCTTINRGMSITYCDTHRHTLGEA